MTEIVFLFFSKVSRGQVSSCEQGEGALRGVLTPLEGGGTWGGRRERWRVMRRAGVDTSRMIIEQYVSILKSLQSKSTMGRQQHGEAIFTLRVRLHCYVSVVRSLLRVCTIVLHNVGKQNWPPGGLCGAGGDPRRPPPPSTHHSRCRSRRSRSGGTRRPGDRRSRPCGPSTARVIVASLHFSRRSVASV